MKRMRKLRAGTTGVLFVLYQAVQADTTPLFAWIANVPKHDVLNIRAAPDYRSAKVAAISPEEAYRLKVHRCKKVGKTSRWCLVSPAELYGLMIDDYRGWANARYLSFSYSGYVLVDGKGMCAYALGCSEGMCELIGEVAEVGDTLLLRTTRQVARTRLTPADRFEAMGEEEGYCTIDTRMASAFDPKGAVARFFDALRRGDIRAAAAQIDPKEGLLLTDHIRFGLQDTRMMPEAFIEAWQNDAKRIAPYPEEGDDAALSPLSLREWSAKFPPLEEAEVLRESHDFAGYADPTDDIKAMELGWHVHTGTPHEQVYAVAIVKRRDKRWYLVALLRKRWTM